MTQGNLRRKPWSAVPDDRTGSSQVNASGNFWIKGRRPTEVAERTAHLFLVMALAAGAARSMWLSTRRHLQEAIGRLEHEIATLHAAVGELATADQARSFNEEMKGLAERGGQEIAALHRLMDGLDIKYAPAASQVSSLADNVNEETKRLLAELDNALG
jgi:hypothetical protein